MLIALLASACASATEAQLRADLALAQSAFAPRETEREQPAAGFHGSFGAYVTYAHEHSPALRAAFEKWRAAVARIPQARRLPEPMLDYGYFVQSIETRVGSQRQRFGISQSFPWPVKLTAGAGAASLAARSAERDFEAASLALTRQVADAYWRLWLIERTREIDEEQRTVLKQDEAVTQALLEVGRASLANFEQIALSLSRIEDALAGLDEQERAAGAALVAAVGAPAGTSTPVDAKAPVVVLPDETQEALLQAALSHPRVQAPALMASASEELARAAAADRYPGFTLGGQYIQTNAIPGSSVVGNGKDAIIASIGVKLPLWQGIYSAEIEQARAESASYQAREAEARDRATADVVSALSRVRDAVRRVLLYRDQLIPQAETAYNSTLAGYRVGNMTVASVLIAERDLLDLRLGLRQELARWAESWARLEEVVGRNVKAQPPPAAKGAP
jgi:cobalt-zinc-cadmium efflux system outer membrane protein